MRIRNEETGAMIPEVERRDGVLGKMLGLRFRRDGRVLFTFSRPTSAAIDMVFVPVPLDIAFLDADMEIMEIHGALPVTLHPVTWRLYRPDTPYRYVLEVEKGLLERNGFEEGHKVDVID